MMRIPRGRTLLCFVASLGLLFSAAAHADVQPEGVHYFKLANGLQLVVAVRPELKLAAVNTTVNLGAIDDPPGLWGMALMLEHVTLQGSVTIGSFNTKAEADALENLDRAFAALDSERRKSTHYPGVLEGLDRWFEDAQEAANKQAEVGEIIGRRLEELGAIGLNATTKTDFDRFLHLDSARACPRVVGSRGRALTIPNLPPLLQ